MGEDYNIQYISNFKLTTHILFLLVHSCYSDKEDFYMTTMFTEDVICSICSTKSNHKFVGSTNSFGGSDLDTRPPEMQRSTILYWVQRCPSCNYCSDDISKCNTTTHAIVKSKEYIQIISDESMPQTAIPFLALSYEKEQQQDYSLSAWKAIHAAWVCDDVRNVEASVKCRIQAIKLINKAIKNGQKLMNQLGATELIKIDLMRRIELFDDALELCESTIKNGFDEIVKNVLNFEMDLIRLKDNKIHSMEEIL
jgi:hypothetical protein